MTTPNNDEHSKHINDLIDTLVDAVHKHSATHPCTPTMIGIACLRLGWAALVDETNDGAKASALCQAILREKEIDHLLREVEPTR